MTQAWALRNHLGKGAGEGRQGRAGGEGFLGAQIPDFIVEGLDQVDWRGGVATPGGFLRGDSPSPAHVGSTGPGSSGLRVPRRVMSRCGLGFGGRERQRPDVGSSGRRRAYLACPCQERPRLPWPSSLSLPSPPPSPTHSLSLMKEGLGRPWGGRKKMQALELSLNCSRS